jgi:hypothetical protein
VNTDIRVLNAARYLHDRAGRCGESQLPVHGVHAWRRGAHEREGHDVLCRIAALEMSRSVIRMARCGVVLVGGQPVLVLWVVVIVEGVRVQRRRHTTRRNQRRDEQYRQSAVHPVSV